MKPERAIEILAALPGQIYFTPSDGRRRAIKLGAEALSRLLACRTRNCILANPKLPGETEE